MILSSQQPKTETLVARGTTSKGRWSGRKRKATAVRFNETVEVFEFIVVPDKQQQCRKRKSVQRETKSSEENTTTASSSVLPATIHQSYCSETTRVPAFHDARKCYGDDSSGGSADNVGDRWGRLDIALSTMINKRGIGVGMFAPPSFALPTR